MKFELPEPIEGQTHWETSFGDFDLEGNPIVKQTELDKIISAKISTMPRKDVEKMLLEDWRKAYCVDFKTSLDDNFQMKISADRLNISALIYPKCLRGIIRSLNLRSNINVRLLKDDVFQSFKDQSYFPAMESAKKQFPDDDFYMVIPNGKLN